MNFTLLVISSGVGAIIGYVTNYIAIKLLFKPYKPIKLANFTVFPQGVIPREKEALAKKVGEVVKKYILSENEIKEILNTPEVKKEIEKFLDSKLDDILNKKVSDFLTKEEIIERLSQFVESFVKEKFPMFASFVNANMIKTVFENSEFDVKISDLINAQKTKSMLNSEVMLLLNDEVPKIFLKANIDKIVENKVKNFDEKTLEDMLFSLMKKHFSFINFAGAALGGIIGFVQYFIVINM